MTSRSRDLERRVGELEQQAGIATDLVVHVNYIDMVTGAVVRTVIVRPGTDDATDLARWRRR